MPQERRTCQVFNFTICNQIGYNTTSLPNKRNHTTIEKAADELSDFMQVMSSKCSRYVVTLFCFTYFPFCDTTQWENLDVYDKNDYEPIYPCQDACRTVTSECREEFERQSGGYEWPRVFQNCNTFPETNCAIGPDPEEPTDAGPTDGDGDVTPTEVEPVTSNPTPPRGSLTAQKSNSATTEQSALPISSREKITTLVSTTVFPLCNVYIGLINCILTCS